jgi:hypothetical protein
MSDAPVVVFDPAKDAKFAPAKRSLDSNEEVIRMGLGTFVEVGQALADIRDSGQYREAGFGSFEDYCRDRWGLGRGWANAQISASRVYRAISVHDHEQLPQNVEQTTPLAPVLNSHGEEAVSRAWAEIVASHQGNGPITGREIRAFLNPAVSVAPTKRPMSDAYLSALDKVEAALKGLRWAVRTHEGKNIPKPVCERFAEYTVAAESLARAVDQISKGETPDSFGTDA